MELSSALWERLKQIESSYEELNRLLAEPSVISDPEKLGALAREQADLEELVNKYRAYKECLHAVKETKALLKEDTEEGMAFLVKEEVKNLEQRQENLLQELRLMLTAKDPRDNRDVIMEIRAGTGGDEAAIFAGDLFRTYSRYALAKGWEIEILDANPSDLKGFKEIVFEVKGRGAYSRLKYEKGVHRVQRVPATEASGRIHTSTVTVAVLPEAEEVEINVNPEDLKIEFFHSSGPGGQNVNKVASAVRLTHLSTGITATSQNERSQLRNRMKAMALLQARLFESERQRKEAERDSERRSQVGSGERAEKIRTYNFPQNRVSDHRINLTLYNLPQVMDGELEPIIDALASQQTE